MNDRILYDNIIKSIKLKKSDIYWSLSPNQLTCCIIEPRIHDCLQGVLYNMANIYANLDIGLTVYHSEINEDYIKGIIKHWQGVKLIKLKQNNLTLQEYNRLLTFDQFWTSFTSEYILIFQTDSIIFQSIPAIYFNYDYVGAPWHHSKLKRNIGNNCGNGGFSLRKKLKMIEITKRHKRTSTTEDIYFSHFKMNLPSLDLRKQFSCEEIYSDIPPIGCHKPFAMKQYNYDYETFYKNMYIWLSIDNNHS